MKLLHAKIKGLIGLHRGCNLKEIDIDFTKCRNNIVLIIGGNGSGKSSLLNALNPYPDNTSNYIPKEECFKELVYSLNNTIYKITIIYPINKYGERTTTKAYITKSVDGESPIELNPNGNVSSYKDILLTEFNLDPNFLTLTSLSLEDKGLISKTPAKRKEFFVSIVSKVEVFNNIYKTLNKRSSIFKSMINNIITKIDTIGDEEKVNNILISLDSRIESLSKQRDSLIKNISKIESELAKLDNNSNIKSEYLCLSTNLNNIKNRIETINMMISNSINDNIISKYSDKNTIDEYINQFNNNLVINKSNLDNTKNRLQDLLINKEEESKMLQIKISKLNNLKSQGSFEDMFKYLKITKENINRYLNILNEIGLDENTTLTKEEFILGLETLNDINNQINIIKSEYFYEDLYKSIELIQNNCNINSMINKNETDINDNNEVLNELNNKLVHYKSLYEITKILSNRPSNCKIDNCYFIESAIEASKENPEVVLKDLENQKEYHLNLQETLNNEKNKLKKYAEIIYSINTITRLINNNRGIINKLPNKSNINEQLILDLLLMNRTFDEINNLYKYIDYSNIFSEYKEEKEKLTKLESQYEIYKNRSSIIEEINNDINNLNNSLSNILEKIEKYNNEIFELEKTINLEKIIIDKLSNLKRSYDEYDKLNNEKIELDNKIKSISLDMESINNYMNILNNYNTELLRIDNEIKPIQNEKQKLTYSLQRLSEYKSELEIYNAKYNKVELIKKYSSPSKLGIQTLFINVYMGQTLRIANELLSMFFNGKLRLLDYKIDETSFSIPCTSIESSINNDDVSSCSGGEKCVISMILSFALLQQSSSKYNILRLDEIDGTLDQYNRSMFVDVIHTIIDKMDIENCIMISHSSETVLDNADIICLNMDSLSIPKGNIIYSIN